MTKNPEQTEREIPGGEPASNVIYLPDQSQPVRQRKPGRRAPVPDPRSARFDVRCTPAFRDQVVAAARAAGLSLSAHVCIVLGESRPIQHGRSRLPPMDRQLLVKLLAELGKIGSNHNQLARRQNTTGEEPEPDEWRRSADDIQDMRHMLLRALGYAG